MITANRFLETSARVALHSLQQPILMGAEHQTVDPAETAAVARADRVLEMLQVEAHPVERTEVAKGRVLETAETARETVPLTLAVTMQMSVLMGRVLKIRSKSPPPQVSRNGRRPSQQRRARFALKLHLNVVRLPARIGLATGGVDAMKQMLSMSVMMTANHVRAIHFQATNSTI